MEKWEYREERVPENGDVMGELNQLGAEGWELMEKHYVQGPPNPLRNAGFPQTYKAGHYVLLLKRRKQ